MKFTKTYRCHYKKIETITITTGPNEATIFTPSLKLTSINQHPYAELMNNYVPLFGKQKNVALFCNGIPWNEQQVSDFLTMDSCEWNQGSGFGAFAVHHLNTQQFVGSLRITNVGNTFKEVGIGHPTSAEMGYILDNDYWGQGYDTEIAFAGEKYITHLDAPDITEIVATVNLDNHGSKKILATVLKNHEKKPISRYGHRRELFFKSLSTKPMLDNGLEIEPTINSYCG